MNGILQFTAIDIRLYYSSTAYMNFPSYIWRVYALRECKSANKVQRTNRDIKNGTLGRHSAIRIPVHVIINHLYPYTFDDFIDVLSDFQLR